MGEEDYTDEELEALRRRRLAELQRASSDDQRRAQAQQQVERQKQAIIRRILTPEARQRLTNIRMVKPEFADELEMQLIQLAQSGRLRGQVTDEQLKKTLVQLEGQKREIKIRRA
ncbi:DNA-binding protein [Candidatus Bathyarchaeota archaeon]|nr:DNA-binding protein [Candidatus Bathyarchaeota archaeon]